MDAVNTAAVKRTARTAGLLYLVVVVAGTFTLGYVPSHIPQTPDLAASFDTLRAAETLFRLGIFAGALCYLAFLLLPLALYKLFAPANRTAATLMVALAVVSAPIAFLNLGHRLDVLTLLGNADWLKSVPAETLQAEARLSLKAYGNGLQILKIFWGLWLLPFGWLVWTTRALPRVLGALLMFGCFGYLISFTGNLLFPGYEETAFAGWITAPGSLGEIGTCLWLLIMGAKAPVRAAG
ncbi:MAG: DUF4386 domain-containing protein [Solimonas sp.]